MNKPTGEAWRNWKKSEKRRMDRNNQQAPADWEAYWFSRHEDAEPMIEKQIEVDPLPADDMPVTELIDHLKKRFKHKKEYEQARRLINANVKLTGPIGIVHLGDPHLDDDGTDWDQLEADMQTILETEGMFVANVGDTRNNWVGRLARLFGEQGTSAKQALQLSKWFLETLKHKWLYIIGGNHDAWSGVDDPLSWICEHIDAMYASSEARIGLNFPNGRQIIVNARHDFAGNSQWNAAHAVGKAAQLGDHDDIYVCGHKHTSGYMPIKSPDGRLCHAIQVASYKVYDRYAREKGFRDQAISPCAVTVINPDAEHPADLIQVFWTAKSGADYLNFLRGNI